MNLYIVRAKADTQQLGRDCPKGTHFGGVRKNASKGRTQAVESRKAHEG